MLFRRMLCSALLTGFVCSLGSAAIIADLSDSMDSYTIASVNEAGGIIVGDKLFSDFRVTTTNSVDAVAPGMDEIKVTGILFEGDLGLRFNGGWSAPVGQLADTTIKFKVSIIEPELSQGFLIDDNVLALRAYGVISGNGSGAVSISENVYASDPDIAFSAPVANKLVYYNTAANSYLYDHQYFMQDGQLVALPEIWVVKDVIAYGGTGDFGLAHLSEFIQTFSQIPEPATLAFVLVGGAAMLIRKKK